MVPFYCYYMILFLFNNVFCAGKGDDSPSDTFKGEDENDGSREIASGILNTWPQHLILCPHLHTGFSFARSMPTVLHRGKIKPAHMKEMFTSSADRQNWARVESTLLTPVSSAFHWWTLLMSKSQPARVGQPAVSHATASARAPGYLQIDPENTQ